MFCPDDPECDGHLSDADELVALPLEKEVNRPTASILKALAKLVEVSFSETCLQKLETEITLEAFQNFNGELLAKRKAVGLARASAEHEDRRASDHGLTIEGSWAGG